MAHLPPAYLYKRVDRMASSLKAKNYTVIVDFLYLGESYSTSFLVESILTNL